MRLPYAAAAYHVVSHGTQANEPNCVGSVCWACHYG